MADIKELQKKIKENPNDYNLILEYAIVLTDIGENEEAYKNLMFLKNVMPDNPLIYYNLGIILEKQKDINTAILSYEKSMELSPDNFDNIYNLANLYLKINELEKAENLFLKIIEHDSEDANTLFYLGRVYSKMRVHDKSIEYFKKAIEFNYDDIISKFYLAYEYKESGDIDNAIKTYNEVIQQSPDYSWAYYNLAVIYFEKGDEENALLNLERTAKLNPKDVQAIKLVSSIFIKHKKFSLVEKILQKAISDMPLESDLTYLLARMYKELGAMDKYEKYLQLTNQNFSTFTGDLNSFRKEIQALKNKNEDS